jgi:alpha-L-fucosidase 2
MNSFISGFVKYLALSSNGQKRVTCIGDSITQGGFCAPGSYVDILGSILGSNYEVLNAGVSSMTMLKKGVCNGDEFAPCSYWNTNAWQSALNSEPDIVTIMLGTNDAKFFNWEGIQQNTGDYFALDYVDMIQKLNKLKKVPKIYVLVPPPIYSPFPYEMNSTIINTIYSTLIRDIASVMNVEVIDIFTALSGKDMTCDGCHPIDEGNVIIAETIAAAIAKPNHKC